MGNLLRIYGCFNPYNPYAGFEIIGFILVIVMVVLIIRQKRRNPKGKAVDEITEPLEKYHIEKDVFGMEKILLIQTNPIIDLLIKLN